MIIRMTFCDNDFTQYLEDFCVGLRDRMFNPKFSELREVNKDDYDSVEEYSQALIEAWDKQEAQQKTRERLMSVYNNFHTSSAEYKQICEEVIRLWKEFAKTCDMERWIPYVSIQYKLKEKWENGEVVYYWTPYDKFITQ